MKKGSVEERRKTKENKYKKGGASCFMSELRIYFLSVIYGVWLDNRLRPFKPWNHYLEAIVPVINNNNRNT